MTYFKVLSEDLNRDKIAQSRKPMSGPGFEPETSEYEARDVNHSIATFGQRVMLNE